MRLIDADALSQHFKHMWWPTGESYKGVLIDDIYNAPTLDVAPVRRGTRIDSGEIEKQCCKSYICSWCGERMCGELNYCPNCGANMKGEEK